jgi:hypothetical protein
LTLVESGHHTLAYWTISYSIAVVPFHHVIPVQEETTSIFIPGYITKSWSEWKAKRKGGNRLSPLKVKIQFHEHHRVQSLDLH